MKVSLLGAAAAAAVAVSGVSSATLNTTGYVDEMFDQSMSFLDQIYDPTAGYLWYFYYPLAPGKHETRSTVWYAAGLLRRNQGSDVEEANKILTSVIDGQQKNVSDQWYGDYTKYPEEPTVGTEWYPENIYNSWDPNWRGFIGTTLLVIYEEYGNLLPTATQSLILESLYNNTLGDAYRVGGVDGDNLYPAYSNPWLMRAVITGWTGRKFNDSNMTAAGETYASEFLDLYNLNNTLSEFNSPTYCGVSLFALTLWAKYLPTSSLMGANGPRMIAEIWESVGQLYNANLRNIAGPWDRTYGYDQNLYVGIMNAFLWSMVGSARAPGINTVSRGGKTPYWATNHADDFEIAPLLSVILPYHQTLVPESAWANLLQFPGEHVYTTAAYSPPYDLERRNVTTWLSDNVTVGAQSFDQTVVGGASINPSAWTPVVAQWARPDGSVGWFSWHSTESALDVNVTAGRLEMAYPKGNESSIFTFAIASNPIGQKRNVLGWEDVWGINVTVTDGSVDMVPAVSFCGLLGGACDVINNWEFWNLTYVMPAGSTEVPRMVFEISV